VDQGGIYFEYKDASLRRNFYLDTNNAELALFLQPYVQQISSILQDLN
jgi:hypothetical protein